MCWGCDNGVKSMLASGLACVFRSSLSLRQHHIQHPVAEPIPVRVSSRWEQWERWSRARAHVAVGFELSQSSATGPMSLPPTRLLSPSSPTSEESEEESPHPFQPCLNNAEEGEYVFCGKDVTPILPGAAEAEPEADLEAEALQWTGCSCNHCLDFMQQFKKLRELLSRQPRTFFWLPAGKVSHSLRHQALADCVAPRSPDCNRPGAEGCRASACLESSLFVLLGQICLENPAKQD